MATADKFIGKTARANKKLHLKIVGSDKYIDVSKGDSIGVVETWTGKESDLKFHIETPSGLVFVSPKDIVGGELEKEISDEEEAKRKKKEKEDETIGDKFVKLGQFAVKAMLAAFIGYIFIELIVKKK